MNEGLRSAKLRVRKSRELGMQEVSILDHEFIEVDRMTLTETSSEATANLEPGKYLVSALGPSGRHISQKIELTKGGDKSLQLNVNKPAPHEWLVEANNRQQLPDSALRSLAFDSGYYFNLKDRIRKINSHPAISLSVESATHSSDLGKIGSFKATQSSTGKQTKKEETLRFETYSIRSYIWSAKRRRWVRSRLVQYAFGDGGGDYVMVKFPGRGELTNDLSDKLHMVALFKQDRPATFISMPLFSNGAQLIVSEMPLEAAPVVDNSKDSNSGRSTWWLSAQNDKLDALLQALGGTRFQNENVATKEALQFAKDSLYEKKRDPEAAIVAGLFLLEKRWLDERAQWIENLANWFPWSPDAQILGAWGNLIFDTGDENEVLQKLARSFDSGPAQLVRSRRLLRDLLSITMSEDQSAIEPAARKKITRLWDQLGREKKRETIGGPFFCFKRSYGTSKHGKGNNFA